MGGGCGGCGRERERERERETHVRARAAAATLHALFGVIRTLQLKLSGSQNALSSHLSHTQARVSVAWPAP